VLPHCSAVVSHTGSGTFLASLAAGLPHLCVPQAADQFLNAAACERSATGLVLQPGTVTTEAVRDTAGRLLREPAFAEAAGRLRDEIAAMPSPAEVAAALHRAYA
jgi:UDP:flavonoid glycosyltransferase YjiC (YdhE family)